MKLDLKDLEAKAEAATPGPWNIQLVDGHETCWLDGETAEKPPTIQDLNYIDAANPETIRVLISQIRQMKAALNKITFLDAHDGGHKMYLCADDSLASLNEAISFDEGKE